MDGTLQGFLGTALVTIAALVPITNPPGNAPIFLSLTYGLEDEERFTMARRVAFNCFALLVAATFIGTYILQFFDLSLPVVRVAGGLLVAATGWRLLTAEGGNTTDAPTTTMHKSAAEVAGRAFYPLSFPLTVGPGSISIAITLGASLPSRGASAFAASAGLVVGIAIVCIVIWLAYRFATRFVRLLGATGTAVFLRLSAFILLCIGVQILWDGASELLAPWRAR